jgi:hypothetical protein
MIEKNKDDQKLKNELIKKETAALKKKRKLFHNIGGHKCGFNVDETHRA